MKAEFLDETNAEELDVSEIDDFDAKPASYQVWGIGYDADQNITDHCCLVNESRDPEKAISMAQDVVADLKKHIPLAIYDAVTYIEILVETVVDVEGVDTNVGTLFSEITKIK